ncbi:MAG TPA: carboxypeptidase regulatory-like domain-containing protein [Terriglobales bacterium]|nr:carboxypeptidase regulatory-like domain-containing protein [Terriglobales bacterium]
MLTKRTLLAIFSSLVFPICPLLYGQATGSLSGTVSDKTGSVVTGAKVTVTSQGTGVSRDAVTDDTGHYLVPLLPVAEYTIHVESQGFRSSEQKDIRLQVDEHREVNFTLAPGSVTESVEVNATEVAVRTSDPTLGQVITSQQVAQLPLNGRNFVQLATLTPGTTQETNPDSFFNGGPSSEVSTRGSFSLSVGGSRASSTDWLLDGNDNNELTAGGIAVVPSIDAIQEFKVLTYNYSAQYGTRAGPTVLLNTKSGSNSLHGSLFEFFRNTVLDAQSYFAASKEKFNLNQFGGSIGGPIKRDKTFFFFDYQGTRKRQGIPFTGQVPTAAMRNGDFSEIGAQLYNPYSTHSTGTFRDPFQCDNTGAPLPVAPDGTQAAGTPCNIIPAGLINPIAQQMINLYPLPNVPGTLVGDFVNTPARKLDENSFDVRIDHNFSTNDTLFGRFSFDQATTFIPGGSPGFAEANTFGSTQNITNHGRNIALSETHIFTPTSINQLSVGYNRIFNNILSFGSGTCESQTLGIPGANLGGISCGLTSTSVGGGYWDLGDRGFAPFTGGTNVFSISDSFDMIRGKHNIRVGGEIRANQMNVRTNAFQDGFWVFTSAWTAPVGDVDPGPGVFLAAGSGGDNMANFLLGLPDLALHDQTFKGATTGRRWKLFRPYVQDDWRVTSNLTLNLGLAWALVTPITEDQNRQSNFDFKTGTFLIPGKNSDSRVGVQMDKTAFEPRIGLAWKPFGSEKTAVRAGYAIFHDSSWNQGGQGLWENPPFFAESAFASFFPDLCPSPFAPSGQPSACANNGMAIPFGTGRTMSDGFPLLSQPTDPTTFGGNISSQNLDFKLGRVQQYNLNVERQIPGNVVLTLGYAGSRSSHILVDQMNLNVASPTACGTVPGYTLGCGITSIPYSQFQSIFNINDIGRARYDSLQVKAETKSAVHGLYALLGYTYARAFDSGFPDGLGTSSGTTYFPLPGTKNADWALSQIQLNNNFTGSVIYELPFGKGKQFGNDWNGAVNALLGNWEVDVIEKITSGFPLFIVTSNNASGVNFGSSTNRPDQVCNGRLSNHTVAEFFNTSCFVAPAAGELGNANRTPLYGPGFVNTDFSAIKHFKVYENTDLEFRAEFFNLFNHTQFFQPGQDLASSNFGIIQRTVNNPRLIQFGLKLTF